MWQKLKSLINKTGFVKIYIFGFLLNLFFSYHHVILTKNAYLTGAYSDFTSFSLYSSDLLIIFGFLVYFLPNISHIWQKLTPKPLKFLVLWLLIITIFHPNSPNLSLNLWFLVKFLKLVVSYGTFAYLFSKYNLFGLFIKTFVWFCAFESILALVQFTKQSSIGLYRLGESHIGPNIAGVAKIVSGGTTYIRGYGTFPHPNLLSAFLVTGIFLTIYLLLSSQTIKSRIIYSALLFVNIFGLTLTFSRGAYLALGVGFIIFFGLLLWRQTLSLIKFTLIVTAVSLLTSLILFKPFLLIRATFSGQATIERGQYNKAGLKMIKTHPLFGIGMGESALQMEQYAGKPLKPWEKQPVHNYFIATTAELGIPGGLILVWFLFSILKTISYKLKIYPSTYYLLFTTIFCSFLVLMMFDHYFYTLQQTQLLLWIILAITASEIKNPQEGDL